MPLSNIQLDHARPDISAAGEARSEVWLETEPPQLISEEQIEILSPATEANWEAFFYTSYVPHSNIQYDPAGPDLSATSEA